MKLYVKDVVREPDETLYVFLHKVLQLGTLYHKFFVKDTYFDSEFKILQCESGKCRSFDDIVLISKTYFKVSDKVVAKVIKKILITYPISIFVLCNKSKNWILNLNLIKSPTIKYCTKYNNSDFKTNEHGNGKYSFDDIMTLMGLTEEDVKINGG